MSKKILARGRFRRSAVTYGLMVWGAIGGLPASGLLPAQNTPPAATQSSDELKIVVLEGEDAVNIVKKKTAVQEVVEVRGSEQSSGRGRRCYFHSSLQRSRRYFR